MYHHVWLQAILLKMKASRVLVVHICNPSYSGGRDQEDHGSKPAWANSSVRTYLENIQYKKKD
jgi:hypothetical protein